MDIIPLEFGQLVLPEVGVGGLDQEPSGAPGKVQPRQVVGLDGVPFQFEHFGDKGGPDERIWRQHVDRQPSLHKVVGCVNVRAGVTAQVEA